MFYLHMGKTCDTAFLAIILLCLVLGNCLASNIGRELSDSLLNEDLCKAIRWSCMSF